MRNNITPVLLLTGYLGSGKTTLLNRILNNKSNIKFAVIVNDIGEVNIDARLIAQGGVVGEGDDSLVPLQNGCICCTLKMDLVKQLCDIIGQHKFDCIVIEASGICEPEPIAQTITAYPQLYPNMTTDGIASLKSVITVVDALRLRDEFSCGNDLSSRKPSEEDLASLVIQQVEFCNTILLNKASDVSKAELENIKNILRELQPKAKILTCDFCDVKIDELVNSSEFNYNEVASSARWIEELEKNHDDVPEDEHHHHHEHCVSIENEEEGEALEYGISTFVYQRREPFNLVEFDQFIARFFPKSVLRCKGICYFDSEPDMCYLFEQAGKQVSLSQTGEWYATMPKEELEEFMKENPSLLSDWDEKYGDRMQKLVFIGQNMDREAIETLLDACLTKR